MSCGGRNKGYIKIFRANPSLIIFGAIPMLFTTEAVKAVTPSIKKYFKALYVSKKIAEDEQYIIRHYVTASLFDDFNEKRIYKKQGIVEKYIGSFDGSDIIPHKRHEIHSFHIDESKNVFIGHYHSLLNAKDTVMSFPIVKSNN